jgi:two-component system, chemotaxis family, protein-glutamate methylesterase/glutaminase
VEKPASGVAAGLDAMMAKLIQSVKTAAVARVRKRGHSIEPPPPNAMALDKTTDRVIGLGASTGGVAALGRILPAFPPWSPGIVIVQHMPAGFTADFAKRLDGVCQVRVTEAKDGDRVMSGHVLVAPGGTRHLEVRRFGGEYRVHLVEGPPVSGHVPSVDVFFSSLAQYVGANASACLLTGMGADGAKGLLSLRRAGGRTYAQDRETSAVWGMPAAAHEMGAAERLIALHQIPQTMVNRAAAAA